MRATLKIAEFIMAAKPPAAARQRAATALCDTVGVILAGASEAAAKIIRRTVVAENHGNCREAGTALLRSELWALRRPRPACSDWMRRLLCIRSGSRLRWHVV